MAAKKKTAGKKKTKKKRSPKKKTSRQKAPAKRAGNRAPRTSAKSKNRAVSSRRLVSPSEGAREVPALSGDADSQGLSSAELADSESVSELLEEGNAFEAGVVSGVERADDTEGKEVRTREFPEDDVPEEYLDND